MTQPRIDWDRDVSLPVSGRTTQARHASATGAATASKTRGRLSVAYRDLLIACGPLSDHEAARLLGRQVSSGELNPERVGRADSAERGVSGERVRDQARAVGVA